MPGPLAHLTVVELASIGPGPCACMVRVDLGATIIRIDRPPQVVDAAMTDGASLPMAAQYGLKAKGLWHDERERNFLDGAAPYYGTYECCDGEHVAPGPIEPQFYRRLLERCGIENPAFARQPEEAEWPAFRARFAAPFRTRSRSQWCELLEGTDACFAPVLSIAEAAGHAHNGARHD